MGSYKDVSTMLDAYHQLERGRSVGRLKTAARRLRSLDPANELLPELEARIETLNGATRNIALCGQEDGQVRRPEMLV